MSHKKHQASQTIIAVSLSACLLGGTALHAEELPTKINSQNIAELTSRANAYEANQKVVEALNAFQSILSIDITNNTAMQGTVRMLRKLGDPSLALRYVKVRPDLFTKQEVLEIGLEEAASFVRMGEHDSQSSKNAFRMTDKALSRYSELAKDFGKSSPIALPSPGNFDYLVALFNRHRDKEVIEGYEYLLKKDIKIPDYARMISAASYSRKGQPQKTLEILEPMFEHKKNDIEYLRSVFYALTDTEQFERADSLINEALVRTPEYLTGKQKNERINNPMFGQLIEMSAINKAFNNKLKEAQSEFATSSEKYPDTKTYHVGLGTVALWGGFPIEAQREFNIAFEKNTDSSEYFLHSAAVKFLRGNDVQGRKLLASAAQMIPFDGQVQRLKTDLEIRQSPYIYSEYGSREASSSSYLNNTERNVLFQLGGPVYSDIWRPYVSFVKGRYTNTANSKEYQPLFWSVGAQVRLEDISATVSVGKDANNKNGVGVTGRWQASDNVAVSAEASTATSDLSSRATENKLSATKKVLATEWKPSFDSELTASVSNLNIDDNNSLISASLKAQLHWYRSAKVQAWTSLGYFHLQGDKQNVPYFSPIQYNSIDFKLGASWVESRETAQGRYRKHTVELGRGTISQNTFKQQPSESLRYQLSWQWTPRVSTEMSFDRIKTAYDGMPEMHSVFKLAIKVIQ